jgi:inositol oxygenase
MKKPNNSTSARPLGLVWKTQRPADNIMGPEPPNPNCPRRNLLAINQLIFQLQTLQPSKASISQIGNSVKQTRVPHCNYNALATGTNIVVGLRFWIDASSRQTLAVLCIQVGRVISLPKKSCTAMAPSALPDASMFDGRALDLTSDDIDAVNFLKNVSLFGNEKDTAAFRQYNSACSRVKNFYAEQHTKQTVDFNLAARARFWSESRVRPEMTIFEAMQKLDALIDDSDPDTQLSQTQHLLQTAEALRRDGKPRWMQCAGLVHDLGKLMIFTMGSEGQWDVVGDTFPVGCRFDEKIIYHETFDMNPDAQHPIYRTEYGIYRQGCGLNNVMLSWGHDEYLFNVLQDQSTLPPEALAMVRYHSFYAWHREGAYKGLMSDSDWETLKAVQAFNPYDLYSKSDDVPDIERLKVGPVAS